MLDVSYSDEFGSIEYLCDEKSQDFPNVSFDSNISIQHIGCKSDIVHHLPVDIPSKKQIIEKLCGSQKNKIPAEQRTKIEHLDISYSSNDSIELYDLQKENRTQSPGILLLLNSLSL